MDDEVVEESIEYADDDDAVNIRPGGLPLTRHTRSHYDLHSKKEGATRSGAGRGGGHSHSQSLRATTNPSRVPLQPRLSTPPCASLGSNSCCGTSGNSMSSSSNSWGAGGQRSSNSCLSPSAVAPQASSASSASRRNRASHDTRPHANRELRVAGGSALAAGVSPSVARNQNAFWQLPASPVRHAMRGSALTPDSPDAQLVPGSPIPMGLAGGPDGLEADACEPEAGPREAAAWLSLRDHGADLWPTVRL